MSTASAHITLKKAGSEQIIVHGSVEATKIFVLIKNVGEIGAQITTEVTTGTTPIVVEPHGAQFFFLEKGTVKAKLVASATDANAYTVLHVQYFFPGHHHHGDSPQPPPH